MKDPGRLVEPDSVEFIKEMVSSASLHRTVVSERERDYRAQQCDKLDAECATLRAVALVHSALRQAHHDLKGASTFGSSVMFAGTVAIGWAGVLSSGPIKVILLSAGLAASTFGLASAFGAPWWIKKQRPLVVESPADAPVPPPG